MGMHTKAKNFANRYFRKCSASNEPMDSLRSLGFLLGFMAIFMGSMPMAFDQPLFGGGLPPGEPGWHLHPFRFPFWEIMFIGGGIVLLISTYLAKHQAITHGAAAIAWLSSGAVWIAYGIQFEPDYVFALGIISLFMAAQHGILAKLWTIEKVE